MATFAPDQRIKLFFPTRHGTPSCLPNRPDWYDVYRSIPPAERAAMRTFTIRHLRVGQCELDVDFALHGETGPASRWALGAQPGDRIQIAAPDARHEGDTGGYEWKPPARIRSVLLIADETALPATMGILEALAGLRRPPATEAFIEIPSAEDQLQIPHRNELRVQWLVRGHDAPNGQRMTEAARRARLPAATGWTAPLPEIDVDEEVLWDRAGGPDSDFYAWVAGEAAAVSRIRTFLIKDRGIDRRRLNLMGYWRLGKTEG